MVPMLQCGLVRSNFSLAIVSTFAPAAGLLGITLGELERVAGIEPASSAWKAAALPLCYTRQAAGSRRLPVSGSGAPYSSLKAPTSKLIARMVGEVGLEPTKAYARGFTVPPLCHSGHSPKHAMEFRSRRPLSASTSDGKPSNADAKQKLLGPVTDDAKSSAGWPRSPRGPKSERVL